VQQSNFYIIAYTAGLTIVCGLLLAFASESLKPMQQANIALEKQKNILSTVGLYNEEMSADQVRKVYSERVKSYVVNYDGAVVEGKKAESIEVAAEYKKNSKERQLPVYEVTNATNPSISDYFVLPLFGYGLWDNIWGYVSLQNDMNTIYGINFSHKGETPGLGARIATSEIQERYKGKTIFEGDNIVSVTMQKGEQGGGAASIEAFKSEKHQVDGMSGATITGKGVNNMLSDYFNCYLNFIKTRKSTTATALVQ
jgi:Na+-transporting NADH:ubiquinone oxidoreductase subunit C